MELLHFTAILVITSCVSMAEAGAPACYFERSVNFTACVNQLDTNLGPYVDAVNITGFLNELCSPGKSFPLLECVDEYSEDCPSLLGMLIVQRMQFGPYQLADLANFDSAQNICECTSNIGCLEQLLSIQMTVSFRETSPTSLSPWKTMPNYATICQNSFKPWIECVGTNLGRCKAGITAKYQSRFTAENADQTQRLAAFTDAHCSRVESPEFASNYACVESQSKSLNMQACFLNMDEVLDAEKPCVQRGCIETTMADACGAEWVNFFIDAVNVYGSVEVPKHQCEITSGAITLATRNIVTVTALGFLVRLLW